MSENPDESEVFEICDFTTPTEWERFVARLEEVLHEWQLNGTNLRFWYQYPDKSFALGVWRRISEELTFGGFKFRVSYHILNVPDTSTKEEQDLDDVEKHDALERITNEGMCAGNDFLARFHSLARWYGCGEFLTLSPASGEFLTSESKIKLVLSSACMALRNSGCYLPIFVQAQATFQQLYIGIREAGSFRTEYDMVHLRMVPLACLTLSGLLNIFNAKLGSMQNSARVRVSIRLNYALTDWVHLFWSQKPPSLEFFLESEDLSLPFGCRDDPISELSLGAVWPSMVEDTVIESEHYSDFDPLYAPEWRVSVQMAEMTSGLMTLYLESLLQSCSDRRAYASFGGAFDRLTEPIPSLSSVLETTGDNFKKSAFFPLGNWNEAILPSDLILKMISMLFDDSESKTSPTKHGAFFDQSRLLDPFEVKLRGCKTAPQDSLLWRLALVFSHALASLGGPPGAAQLWHAFIVQLRVCWDNSQLLPGLMLGPPNLAHCLLYQKLQMLNCCIEQRINRTKGLVTKEFETDSSKDMDGEDEFFECEENLNVEEVSAKEEFRHAPWNQPTGRLRKYENFLLLHSDEPLYIPITQEPSPVTEDILEQQAEILLRLGSDATGAEQRAKMQSACLLSDMESFKAANPNAALEDFVRWYSPKDWILEPGEPEWSKKGQLSVRMNIPGNQWQSLWASSKPVPARRQRRLFDETREAEKVFHYLSTLNSDLGSVASLLLSTVLHCAIVKLLDEKKKVKIKIPVVDALLANAINRFVPASRASQVDPVVYEEIINDVRNVEFIMSKAVSLQKKFLEDLGEISEDEGEDPADEGAYDSQASDEDASEDDGINQELVRPESREIIDFVSQLMTGSEVEVSDGPSGRVGCVIKSFFSSAYKNDDDIAGSYDMKPVDEVTKQKFPLPITKEYIFRVQASRPTPYSAPTPQRMYACVSDSEIRIAASFTQDTRY